MDKFMKISRILITLLAIIFLFIFISAYCCGRVLNIGNITGIIICLILIFKFGFMDKYISFKELFCKKMFTKIIWKIYSFCGIAFAVYAILVSSLMIGVSFISPKENSTAVVLGAKVNPNGPSIALWGRIKAAEKYLKENPHAEAVVTGGKGQDEPISEAECMYECLVKNGIQADRIVKEDKATDTMENLKFSYVIIKENEMSDNLAIATDSYHQLRTRIIAHKLNIDTNIGSVNAVPDSFIGIAIYPTYFVREWFALPAELLGL